MSWRERVRRLLPYVIAAVSGFLLAYLILFFFVFRPNVLPDTGQVPDVVGMEMELARTRLENAGFELEMGTYRAHPIVPKGAVADQRPPAGSALERGGRVVVVVSAGAGAPEPAPDRNTRTPRP